MGSLYPTLELAMLRNMVRRLSQNKQGEACHQQVQVASSVDTGSFVVSES